MRAAREIKSKETFLLISTQHRYRHLSFWCLLSSGLIAWLEQMLLTPFWNAILCLFGWRHRSTKDSLVFACSHNAQHLDFVLSIEGLQRCPRQDLQRERWRQQAVFEACCERRPFGWLFVPARFHLVNLLTKCSLFPGAVRFPQKHQQRCPQIQRGNHLWCSSKAHRERKSADSCPSFFLFAQALLNGPSFHVSILGNGVRVASENSGLPTATVSNFSTIVVVMTTR